MHGNRIGGVKMIKELVTKNRSYRRFDEKVSISTQTLKELIDLARLSPSAANLQPFKYSSLMRQSLMKRFLKI